ncbi:MAG: lipopolysaccharide kinase InaA family protein [Bdellovibrionota bacterium]
MITLGKEIEKNDISTEPVRCEIIPLLGESSERVELCQILVGRKRIRLIPSSPMGVHLEALLQASAQPSHPVSERLGGRTTIIPCVGDGDENVVLKSYHRGGVLRNVLPKGVFLGWGEERSEREFRALVTARALGILVPRPLGTIVTTGLFRREWLIMESLPAHRTLASIALDEERSGDISAPLEHYLRVVADSIEQLVEVGILHVDLHPGNVVVSDEGNVFLIDFDHAEATSCNPKLLRERYIRRWRRAVIKHELPEFLSEIFCGLLRRRENSLHEEAS